MPQIKPHLKYQVSNILPLENYRNQKGVFQAGTPDAPGHHCSHVQSEAWAPADLQGLAISTGKL